VDVSLLNKTSTRLPEAMFMSFDPPHRSELKWSMQKLASWIEPSETLDGGTKVHASLLPLPLWHAGIVAMDS
jgi:hypothetical protein